MFAVGGAELRGVGLAQKLINLARLGADFFITASNVEITLAQRGT
jgi:hypothetical protein